MTRQKLTARILTGVAVAMLGLGFASKPLYDTFCKVTGYGGTTKQAEENESDVLDRQVTIYFDSNVEVGLPWDFSPEQVKLTVNVGQSGLAYYTVKNTSKRAVTGTATYNVTPTKAAPFFIKTECFCFTEQRIEPGEVVSFPVLFHVDSQIDDDKRLKDVRDITLSYTFFEIEGDKTEKPSAQLSQENETLN